MTTTLPILARPTIKTLSQNMAKGTLVRVANETGVFRISSPAGWGGPDNATATCYNLLGPYGRCVSAVPVSNIHALTTDETRDAEVRGELDQPAPPRIHPILSRMLRHLELTLRLGIRLLGRETAGSARLRNAKAPPKARHPDHPWHLAFASLCHAAYVEAALPAQSAKPGTSPPPKTLAPANPPAPPATPAAIAAISQHLIVSFKSSR